MGVLEGAGRVIFDRFVKKPLTRAVHVGTTVGVLVYGQTDNGSIITMLNANEEDIFEMTIQKILAHFGAIISLEMDYLTVDGDKVHDVMADKEIRLSRVKKAKRQKFNYPHEDIACLKKAVNRGGLAKTEGRKITRLASHKIINFYVKHGQTPSRVTLVNLAGSNICRNCLKLVERTKREQKMGMKALLGCADAKCSIGSSSGTLTKLLRKQNVLGPAEFIYLNGCVNAWKALGIRLLKALQEEDRDEDDDGQDGQDGQDQGEKSSAGAAAAGGGATRKFTELSASEVAQIEKGRREDFQCSSRDSFSSLARRVATAHRADGRANQLASVEEILTGDAGSLSALARMDLQLGGLAFVNVYANVENKFYNTPVVAAAPAVAAAAAPAVQWAPWEGRPAGRPILHHAETTRRSRVQPYRRHRQ